MTSEVIPDSALLLLPKAASWKDLEYVKSLVPRRNDYVCSISVDEHFMFYDKSVLNPSLAWIGWIPLLGPYLANIAIEAESIALDLKHLIFRSLRAGSPLWLQSIAIPLLTGTLRRPLPRLVRDSELAGPLALHLYVFIMICTRNNACSRAAGPKAHV